MNYIDFFANEYNAEHWDKFSKCFQTVDVKIDGIPQDIINAVITILGKNTGIQWMNNPLKAFDGKNVIELVSSENGLKAIKAYIMRLPN